MTRKEWRDRADHFLRMTEVNRLDVEELFPKKEHLLSTSSTCPTMRENLQRLFNKNLTSLMDCDCLGSLLKVAPPELQVENDRMFEHLKKLYFQTTQLQIAVKDFLHSKDMPFSQAKALLGRTLSLGVGFVEATPLRTLIEEYRRMEQSLTCNFLSLDQLDEIEIKLRKEKVGQLDPSISQHLAEKRALLESLEARLFAHLSKSSLTSEELRSVCEIIDQANNAKCKLSHFRHVCDLRDSFRWVHLLNIFLSQPDHSLERFSELVARQEDCDLMQPIVLEEVKQKVRLYIDSLDNISDLQIFRAMLDPIKDIQLTDPFIQGIISLIETNKWSVVAKHKLNTKTMSRIDLEEIVKNIESIAKAGLDQTLHKILDIYEQLVCCDHLLKPLLSEIKYFLEPLDDNKIALRESQLELEVFNSRYNSVQQIFKCRLDCIPELQIKGMFRSCRGLLAILNCSSALNLKGSIQRDQIDEVGYFCSSEVELQFKNHPLVKPIVDCLNVKRIITEFLLLLKNQRLSHTVLPPPEKMEYRTAKRYISMIQNEDSPIDYKVECGEMDSAVQSFLAWEEEAKEFIKKYNLLSLDPAVILSGSNNGGVSTSYTPGEECILPELNQFSQDINDLLSNQKSLIFSSPLDSTLKSIQWAMEVITYSRGRKRKRYEWDGLLLRGKELRDSCSKLYKAVEQEIKETDNLKSMGHECYGEKTSHRSIQKLKEKIDQCKIDISEETAFFRERLDVEEELHRRIDSVVNSKNKYRINDIETLAEDIKTSGITFDDFGNKLENTLIICKAFVAAIKEMNKEPGEVKRAKHIYASLPLYSHSFEIMTKQLEEEEKILDRLDELLSKPNALEDFKEVSKMEHDLSQIKFYNVYIPKLALFKKKIAALIKLSNDSCIDFTISLVALKSMRLESADYLKKVTSDSDHELEMYNTFLTEMEEEALSYLDSLNRLKNPTTLDQISKKTIGFVDISSEILDIQAKLKIKSMTGTENYSNREVGPVRIGVSSKPNLRKFDLNISLTSKQALPPPPGKKLDIQIEDKYLHDPGFPNSSSANHQNIIPPAQPSKPTMVQEVRKESINRGLDILSLRGHLTTILKLEIQRNHFLNESDLEATCISQTIERAIFSKSLDGSYPTKMPKVIRLFQAMVRLKRISLLLGAKSYNIDIILFLIDRPLSVLLELENDREKLLEALRLVKKAGKYLSNEADRGKRNRPKPTLRHDRINEEEHGGMSKRPPQRTYHRERSRERDSTQLNHARRLRKSRGTEEESFEPLGRTLSLFDNYRIAQQKAQAAKEEEAEQNNRVADMIKDTEKLVEPHKVSFKTINEKKEIDIISEEELRERQRPDREDRDGYKITNVKKLINPNKVTKHFHFSLQ